MLTLTLCRDTLRVVEVSTCGFSRMVRGGGRGSVLAATAAAISSTGTEAERVTERRRWSRISIVFLHYRGFYNNINTTYKKMP